MPQFKQPIPLQALVFKSVVRCTVNYCDGLSVKGSLTDLRESIAVIKQYVSDHIPGILFVEFCRKFLAIFYFIGRRRTEKRLDSHNRVVLEIIMDIQFVGLTCEGDIQYYLNPCDVHRIQGLKVLDWTQLRHHRPVPRGLENYRLQDLTTFIFPRMCTDLDLEIIGPRCPKLEVLRIQESRNVTDRGLRALSPCSELRFINIHYCPVSDNGVNELLNAHKKIEEFNVGQYFLIRERSFDLLSRPITSVCPSVKRFSLKTDPVTNAHLHSVVALFPNLTYLEFCLPFSGDLCILKDLKNLANLDFGYSSVGFSMENLKDLLKTIGANVTRLTLRSDVYVTQNDLHFLSKTCGNIELMYFCYRPTRPKEKLIVPPFHNLKHLECVAYPQNRNCHVKLEFCEMTKLEILRIQGFDAIFEMTESMMLDNAKFPNLREVRTFKISKEHANRVIEITKNNNLDFSLTLLGGNVCGNPLIPG